MLSRYKVRGGTRPLRYDPNRESVDDGSLALTADLGASPPRLWQEGAGLLNRFAFRN
jgi:hypothetical protein